MSSMTVKELAKDMGLTELMTRELIKAGKFNDFAWAMNLTGRRWTVCINRERYELWKKGIDMQKAPKELADSMSATNK